MCAFAPGDWVVSRKMGIARVVDVDDYGHCLLEFPNEPDRYWMKDEIVPLKETKIFPCAPPHGLTSEEQGRVADWLKYWATAHEVTNLDRTVYHKIMGEIWPG